MIYIYIYIYVCRYMFPTLPLGRTTGRLLHLASRRQRPCQEAGDHLKKTASCLNSMRLTCRWIIY